MSLKWAGAALVIIGCSGVGFSMAVNHKREETLLQQLLRILIFMECELQYRLTPLPELCRQAGEEVRGILRDILLELARELDCQVCTDAYSCMTAALKRHKGVSARLRKLLLQLGHTLGRFDLPGQLQGLQAVRSSCEKELNGLEKDKDSRLRSYQTLGVCAGAALAILFA